MKIMNKKKADKRYDIIQEKNIPFEVLAEYQKVRTQIEKLKQLSLQLHQSDDIVCIVL